VTFQGIMSGGKPSAMALLSEDLYGGVSVDLGLQSAAIKGHNATNSIVQQYYHTSSQYQNDLSLNQTRKLESILSKYDDNMAVSGGVSTCLILAYSILIAVGSGGNLMVLTAVAANKLLRKSARNIFIAYLASADLILCVFNMPMTLALTLTKSWPFYSDSWVFCKSVLTFQAVTVFQSSFLITLIALDRRQFIINPSKTQIDYKGAVKLSCFGLVLSFVLASPITIYSHIDYLFDDTALPARFKSPAFCVEDFSRFWKVAYSMGALLIQYIIPSIIVCTAYIQILWRLKHRPQVSGDEKRRREMEQKRRKSINMLIIVATTYFVSWAPMNGLNLIINVFDSTDRPLFSKEEHYLLTYAAFHLMGTSSACINPFLYGFMNENFQGAFKNMLDCRLITGVCKLATILFSAKRANKENTTVIEANDKQLINNKPASNHSNGQGLVQQTPPIAGATNPGIATIQLHENPEIPILVEEVDEAVRFGSHVMASNSRANSNHIQFEDNGREAVFV